MQQKAVCIFFHSVLVLNSWCSLQLMAISLYLHNLSDGFHGICCGFLMMYALTLQIYDFKKMIQYFPMKAFHKWIELNSNTKNSIPDVMISLLVCKK